MIEVGLAVEEDFCVTPFETEMLDALANLRRRGFEVGVDQDVPGGRGDEVSGEVLAADVVKVIGDLEWRERRGPLGVFFGAGGEDEEEGEEWEEAAHGFGKSHYWLSVSDASLAPVFAKYSLGYFGTGVSNDDVTFPAQPAESARTVFIVMKTLNESVESDERITTSATELMSARPPVHRLARRSFLRRLGLGAVLMGPGAAILGSARNSYAQVMDGGRLTPGDRAILRFLAAAELIEADLWQQYTELAEGNEPYEEALDVIDEDMPQYISDNNDDEISHADFLNAFLQQMDARPVNLDAYRTLPSSQATGAKQIGRLTNLMNLTVDTSWWIR